jgi:hypothetical protein
VGRRQAPDHELLGGARHPDWLAAYAIGDAVARGVIVIAAIGNGDWATTPTDRTALQASSRSSRSTPTTVVALAALLEGLSNPELRQIA